MSWAGINLAKPFRLEGGSKRVSPSFFWIFEPETDKRVQMKRLLLDILICPVCLPQENILTCQPMEKDDEDIFSGSLQCGTCGSVFPIQEGIAFLLPGASSSNHELLSKYEESSFLSSYLWSHYGDLLGDAEANTSYAEWAELLGYSSGFSLDAGCAVGRFTFEMSNRSDFAVGIDISRSFVRKARELMINRKLQVRLREEGVIEREQTISFPHSWKGGNTEFIVGDAQSLPFRAGCFSNIASLNLVDKARFPLMHLKEMNRVARKCEAQFLLSDPFSWSSEVAREEDWLGGTYKGRYPGRGIDNVSSLLTGERSELMPAWKVDRKGHIWWKIRNHQNHFELIRSCYVKAIR
jgi:uncharacterized protein YbaR (Trm112 family)